VIKGKKKIKVSMNIKKHEELSIPSKKQKGRQNLSLKEEASQQTNKSE